MLLEHRLHVRAQAARVYLVAGGLAAVAVGLAGVSGFATSNARIQYTTVRWYMAASLLLAAGSVSHTWIVARKERTLAARLTRRATDDLLVTLWARLGPLRTLAIALVILADAWVVVDLLILAAPSALILTYGASLIVVLGCSVLAARQLLRSPTVALDQSSLAIDHRLRVEDLMASVSPLVFFPIGISTPLALLAGAGHPVASCITLVLPINALAFQGLALRARARAAQPARIRASHSSFGGAR